MALVAVVAAVLTPIARADARPSDEASFRFSYSQTEARSPAGQRALDNRLRDEVASFCRRQIGSPVLQLGCERSVRQAARQALRARAGA